MALGDASQSLLSHADELDASPRPASHAVAARLLSDEAFVIATERMTGSMMVYRFENRMAVRNERPGLWSVVEGW